MSAYTMTAKYNGRCDCGGKVRRGDTIQYSRALRRVTGCSSCGTHDKGDGDACAAHAMSQGAIVGPCWDCKAPAGRFRSYGASTPVYCDTCHDRRRNEAAHAAGAAAMSAEACG
jgi:hypothetical protein